MTRRHIRLSFASGESAVAELLDDEAPGTCEYIWSMLPLERDAVHGMYSGAEVFVVTDDPQPAPLENLIHLALPGELLYFYDPGAGGVGRRGPTGEICLAYGRGVMLRGHEGVSAYASLFARIAGDWKYDWTDLAQACRRARWQGPQKLRIERA